VLSGWLNIGFYEDVTTGQFVGAREHLVSFGLVGIISSLLVSVRHASETSIRRE
jgi:hypothetical protein